ncbi:hypothetical protein BDM02DRAFT_3133249 [Thelephora ganbajun]|uniref:Uncharacterized protein n=1 Tax=Thelephora ganbajun TaxID=370292 RepID=A0ACB6YY63_THEGA|nr:hypothetical protein BDM02DRAFT_3133249 [Thelephora ganbajun]
MSGWELCETAAKRHSNGGNPNARQTKNGPTLRRDSRRIDRTITFQISVSTVVRPPHPASDCHRRRRGRRGTTAALSVMSGPRVAFAPEVERQKDSTLSLSTLHGIVPLTGAPFYTVVLMDSVQYPNAHVRHYILQAAGHDPRYLPLLPVLFTAPDDNLYANIADNFYDLFNAEAEYPIGLRHLFNPCIMLDARGITPFLPYIIRGDLIRLLDDDKNPLPTPQDPMEESDSQNDVGVPKYTPTSKEDDYPPTPTFDWDFKTVTILEVIITLLVTVASLIVIYDSPGWISYEGGSTLGVTHGSHSICIVWECLRALTSIANGIVTGRCSGTCAAARTMQTQSMNTRFLIKVTYFNLWTNNTHQLNIKG